MGKNHRIALRQSSGGSAFSLLVCLVFCTTTSGKPALAQDAAACQFAIARVVSIQGGVDVRRAGSSDWLRVKRLDTAVCAGDQLRTGPLSRAALFVQPETLVRVDQNTTIALSQTTTEILVEFFQDEGARAGRDAHACGAGYFITRFPKRFKVSAPHLNAAVEGTEFQVALRCESTELTVLEGTVRSETLATGEERILTGGQVLAAGPTGPAVFSTLIKPVDAVQWVLYYPPLSDAKTEDDVPTAEQCRGLPTPSDQTCLTQRAEVLLRLGRSEEALRDIDEALSLNPANGDANALRAIIHVARNDKAAALESATAATASSPNSYRGWLALSYAQQASFELEQALESAEKAQALEPNSSLVNARVAELLMSLGRIDEAEASARAGVNANPTESRAHTMLGFVHLAQINTKQARADFEAAIERDSFNPLSRLGLGLAMIRDGKLVDGREQLEIAVALDPTNSLLRSYVGKAYYEENTKERNELAEMQFRLAKEYDPNDPTPWLYDAIRLQTTNRPIDAVDALQTSIELNDNRAVYRSRQFLVEDNAIRGISLARAYREVGFDQLAIRESAVSVNADPDNSSAHRFLADSYLSLPRHEIARQSELLQAQLLQPLNATPVQPQLTEDNLFILKGAGPTVAGFNEYTPLFTQNGLTLQADLLAGDLDTRGDQIILSGIRDRVAFAVSQFAYSNEGFRNNDDFEKQILDGFIQFEPVADISIQTEIRRSDSEFGHLLLAFDPDLFFDDRNELQDSRARLGIRHRIGAGSEIIASAMAIDQHRTVDSFGVRAVEIDTRSYFGEVQHLLKRERFTLVTGLGYDTEKQDQAFFGFPFSLRPYAANAYAYFNLSPFAFPLTAHLGASVDYLADKDDISPSRTQVNPKLGITVSPWRGATVRAATLRVLKRQFATSQTLEPTQIAGFNQFYDDLNATDSRRTALAIDQTLAKNLFAGVELSRRDLTVPFDFTGEEFDWKERNGQLYVYWAPTSSVALTAAYEQQEFSRPPAFPGIELIAEIETRTAPLGLAVHLRNMIFARLVSTYVEQTGDFFSASLSPVPSPGEDTFWITDVGLGYRFPRRTGTVSVDIRNLFDEQFQFHETDLFTRQFARERVVLFRLSLAF